MRPKLSTRLTILLITIFIISLSANHVFAATNVSNTLSGIDLSVEAIAKNISIHVSESAFFTINVTNIGNQTAKNVSLLIIHQSFQFNSSTPNATLINPINVSFVNLNNNSLDVNVSAVITLGLKGLTNHSAAPLTFLVFMNAQENNISSFPNLSITLNQEIKGDEFESFNDDSSNTTNILLPRIAQFHTFSRPSDVDYAQVSVRSGLVYQFDAINANSSTNSNLKLLDVIGINENIFFKNNDSDGGLNSRIIYRANATKNIVVKADPFSNVSLGPYILRVLEFGDTAITSITYSNTTIKQGETIVVNMTVNCQRGTCVDTRITLDPEQNENDNAEETLDSKKLSLTEKIKLSPQRVIIKMKPGTSLPLTHPLAKASVNRAKSSVENSVNDDEFIKTQSLTNLPLIAGELSESGYNKLLANPFVDAIYEDQQYSLMLSNSVPLIRANLLHQGLNGSFQNITGAGVSVCVIDTGIDFNNADFGSCSQSQFLNGSCRRIPGGFFIANNTPIPIDTNGHGTHVAGIVGSESVGRIGVAPQANIIPLRVMDESGNIFSSSMAAAFDWCVTNATRYNISVITMSIGHQTENSGYCENDDIPMRDSINNAIKNGLLVSIASGNDGDGTSGKSQSVSGPACVQNATSVGSTMLDDSISSFTNRAVALDLLAPGDPIVSSKIGGGGATLSGTSMATPHIAGVAALMVQANRLLFGRVQTPQSLEQSIKAYGKSIFDSSSQLTFPRVDALNATLAKGIIPMTVGAKPFWTPNQNPINCGNLTENQSCKVGWIVNATYDQNQSFDFFAIVEQGYDTQFSSHQMIQSVFIPQQVNLTLNASIKFVSQENLTMSQNTTMLYNVTNIGNSAWTSGSIVVGFNNLDIIQNGVAAFTLPFSINSTQLISYNFLALNTTSNKTTSISFTLNVANGTSIFNRTDNVTFSIKTVNFPPIINSTPNTTAIVNQLYSYAVSAADVNNDTLRFNLTVSPVNMSINNVTGLIQFVPTFLQQGIQNVTIEVTDGNGGKEIQSYLLNVTRNNTAPVFTTTPPNNATEDTLYIYDVNATDSELDNVTFILSSGPTNAIFNNGTGLLNWTPRNDQVGNTTFIIATRDNLTAERNQSFIVIVLNNPPNITTTPSLAIAEASIYTYDANSSDDNEGNMLWTLITSPGGMIINNATGLIQWQPNTSQIGSNNISIKVDDGNNGLATQNFSINVTQSSNLSINVTSSIIVNMSTQFNVTVSISNTGSKNLTSVLTNLTFNSSLISFVIATNPTASFGSYSETNMSQILVPNATATTIVTFIPLNATANQSTNITAKISANDVIILLKTEKEINISILFVNYAPIFTTTPITTALNNVLYVYDVNATDGNNDTLNFSLIQSPTNMSINSSSGLIQFTPTIFQVGTQNVTILAKDSREGNVTQTYVLYVLRNNTAPNISTSPVINATEDSVYTYDMNATDPEFDNVTFILALAPTNMTINNNTGIITWTPINNHVGQNQVIVTARDNYSAEVNQSFNITVLNIAPTFTTTPISVINESVLFSYDANSSDDNQGNVTFALDLSPIGMIINTTNGLLQWVPNASQIRLHNISLRVNDGNNGTAIQNFSITVIQSSNFTASINASVQNVNMSSNFVLFLNISNSGAKNLSSGIANVSFNTSDIGFVNATRNVSNNSSGIVTLDLGMLQPLTSVLVNVTFFALNRSNLTITNPQISFVFMDEDLVLSRNSSQNITILFINYPPVITSTPNVTALAGSPYAYDVDASDANNDSLSFRLNTAPIGMSINSSSGLISWLPLFNQTGLNNVTVNVSDARFAMTLQDFSINVSRNNTAPVVLTTPIVNATEDILYQYDINVSDNENDSITFSLVSGPIGMSTNTTSGLIAWTANNSQVGTQSVQIKITDALNASTNHSFTIQVANSLPNFTTNPVTSGTENVAYAYNINTTDENDGLTSYSLVLAPINMSINTSSGIIAWKPTTFQTGLNNVSAEFNDGNGGIIVQNFSLNVSDISNPLVNILSPIINSVLGNESVTISFNASDNHAVRSCSKSVDSNTTIVFENSTNTSVTTSFQTILADGDHSVSIICSDDSSGLGTFLTRFNIDTTAPFVQILSPVNGFNTSNNLTIQYATGDAHLNSVQVVFNGTSTNINASGIISIIVSEGQNQTIKIKANDSLGFKNESSIIFNVDRTPPRGVVSTNASVLITGSNPAFVLLNGTGSSDNINLANVSWDFDSVDGFQNSDSSISPIARYTTPGTYTARLLLTDSAGNTNTSFVSVFVRRDTDGDGLADTHFNNSVLDVCPLVSDSSNNIARCTNDVDGDTINDSIDFIIGNVSNVITNEPSLTITVNNIINPISFSGLATVRFSVANLSVVQFEYNLSNTTILNLSGVNVVRENGAVFLSGFPSGINKQITIPRDLFNRNAACLLDQEVQRLSSVSVDCTGPGEVSVNCTGSSGAYSCTDLNPNLVINNLTHSAVRLLTVPTAVITPPTIIGTANSEGGSRRFVNGRSGGRSAFVVNDYDTPKNGDRPNFIPLAQSPEDKTTKLTQQVIAKNSPSVVLLNNENSLANMYPRVQESVDSGEAWPIIALVIAILALVGATFVLVNVIKQ